MISPNLAYFLGGALLPTIGYFFLLRKAQRLQDAIEYPPSDEDEDDPNGAFASPEGLAAKEWGIMHAPYKMVLCVNTNLASIMGKGKMAAQCGHAAVGCFKRGMRDCPNGVRAWERTGSAKICVKCQEEDMEEIAVKAISKGIPVYLVEDAGRTQIPAGSRTVLGLGPAPASVFEGVSDHLKLM